MGRQATGGGALVVIGVLTVTGCVSPPSGPGSPTDPPSVSAAPTGPVSTPAVPTSAATPLDLPATLDRYVPLLDAARAITEDQLSVDRWDAMTSQFRTSVNRTCVLSLQYRGSNDLAPAGAPPDQWRRAISDLLVDEGFTAVEELGFRNGATTLESVDTDANTRFDAAWGASVILTLEVGTTPDQCG